MKFRRSLRFRIVFSFCIFGAILVAIYGLFLHTGISFGRDTIIVNLLRSEIDNFLEQYRINQSAALPNSAYIKAYQGYDQMPAVFKKTVQNLGEGLYETSGPYGIAGPKDYHIAVKKMPGSQTYLYLLFDGGRFKMDESRVDISLLIMLAGFVVVTLAGGWLSLFISRKIIAPVTRLADKIKHMDPETNDLDLSHEFGDDEIGFLARTLEQSIQRTKTMIEREKQFTRDASHELRTPLTIMKGALELIQESPAYQEQTIQKPMKRIERSVEEMRLTIESFLWLAREEAVTDKRQACDAFSIIQESIEQNRQIFKDKPIEIELIVEEKPTISVPPAVFQVIINNLLRNAFHFTMKGKISVYSGKDHIRVTDTGTGIDPAVLDTVTQPHVRGKTSQGFGLGLAIVQRLCERFGLRLTIESDVNQGTTVQIWFSNESDSI